MLADIWLHLHREPVIQWPSEICEISPIRVEYLAALKVSVPVTQLAKWKTTIQMVAIAFLLVGPAGDKIFPLTTQIGLVLLWIAALVTLYTGYDYFRAGLKHIMDE